MRRNTESLLLVQAVYTLAAAIHQDREEDRQKLYSVRLVFY